MSCLGWVGEMVETGGIRDNKLSVEWKIADFLSLPAEDEEFYFSPEFRMGTEDWFLTIWPKWENEPTNPASGWIRVDFVRSDGGLERPYQVRIGIKGSSGVEMEREVEKEFLGYSSIDLHDFCSRDRLMEHKSRLMPHNMLIVRCILQRVVSSVTRDVCTQVCIHSLHEAFTEVKQSLGEIGCVICYEKPVECVLYKCGHMCMCYHCACILRNSNSPALCPMCRNPIQDVIKVYK